LAFAVAAHLEPEILIVDEVLAVGDGGFQKKCLGKMGEVSKGGRTVLFVSHNMQAVTRLCTRGVLLADGRVQTAGSVDQVVRGYLSGGEFGPAQRAWTVGRNQPGDHVARLFSVRVRDRAGATAHQVDIRRPVGIEMEYEVLATDHRLVPNYHVYNSEGTCVFVVNGWQGMADRPHPTGRHRSTMWIPGNYLAEGTHTVWAVLSTLDPVKVHFNEVDAVAFEVVDTQDGDSARGPYAGPYPGVVRPVLTWDNERLPGLAPGTEGAV
jgi:lipopolysaccharide transport system ATP-binding protein